MQKGKGGEPSNRSEASEHGLNTYGEYQQLGQAHNKMDDLTQN
jgi:hypothetical protein